MLIKVYVDNCNFINIRLHSRAWIFRQLTSYSQLQDYSIFLYQGGRIKLTDTITSLQLKEGDTIDAFKSFENGGLKFKIPAILMN